MKKIGSSLTVLKAKFSIEELAFGEVLLAASSTEGKNKNPCMGGMWMWAHRELTSNIWTLENTFDSFFHSTSLATPWFYI